MSGTLPKPDPYKVVVVGMSSVGKSSLVQRLVQGTFDDDKTPTCGADFYTYSVPLDRETIRLQIWDTAGQERFRAISKQYFRNAVGAVLIFDIANFASFEALTGWLNDLQVNCLPNAYILLVGNKADLNAERQIGAQEIKDFAERHDLVTLETSALNGKGVKEAFTRLAMEVSARIRAGEIAPNGQTKGVRELAPFEPQGHDKKKGGCC
jgi:small GTP-binding protein